MAGYINKKTGKSNSNASFKKKRSAPERAQTEWKNVAPLLTFWLGARHCIILLLGWACHSQEKASCYNTQR
jgi:hypothetical protein